ncbi:uncharacterized protein PFL1_04874 [Pseudozyma flocculosa PF-1]|uniref:cAMP-dependent protein kinase regulatory subunit n=2 Tax=Pseudozyma flocculosa TaxID=84751 RepID=A0A5C3F474_9BASI|nr:uncharacterized protein PFL1_04874 [Pseudozyma flocculosa PF-1]EPQ27737.1 hypothetical protein PFL1_04874 [Pseudozyma flocculosa PF-1]SPO39122.1 related to cAMP-dependent protein kinase type II regulatory chain [Pseudozyma flocculosa]
MLSTPAYTNLINDLNRDVLKAKPADPLQFCANWFNARLEDQRRQLLAQTSTDSLSLRSPSAIPPRSIAPGSTSPTQRTSLFSTDPFSQPAPSDQHGAAAATSSQWAPSASPSATASSPFAAAATNFPPAASSGAASSHAPSESPDSHLNVPFIPATFNLGRRTSVSAESMAPSAAGATDPSVALPKTVIPKSDEQMERIRGSIGDNLLFRNLEQDQYRDVLLAMKEVKVDANVPVIEQGAQGDYFYVVESGTLDVYIRSTAESTQSSDDGTGPNSSLAALGEKKVSYGPGSSFGELALLYAQPRAATVLSTSPCTLWALDRVTFRSILMETNSRRRALYEKFLKDVPLFEHLSAAERAKVSDSLEPRDYAIGERVITQGERGSEFFIIVEGDAEVRKRKSPEDGGQEETVGKLSRGDYFGELALLNNAPRAASVVASASSVTSDKLRVVTMSERAFTRLLGPLAGIMGRHAKETYGGDYGFGAPSMAPPPPLHAHAGVVAMSDDTPHPMDSTATPGQGAWSAPNPFAAAAAAPAMGGAGFGGLRSPDA